MNPKPDKIIPALYGGVIIGVISAVPFLSIINCLCCAGVLLGGFMAVYFYKNNFTPDTMPYTAGDCMLVGVIAGVFGAIIDTILSAIILVSIGNIAQEFVLDLLRNMDVEIPEEVWEALEEALSGELTGFVLFLNLVMSMVFFSIFGLLGGLIGYSVYKPKPQIPPPPMPQAS
ncbi:MAG TPA: hypothetical protein VFF29_06985 [Bacteroidota bacterium]|nr:hypothetical protein [Bacteroidota bacterium]